MSVFARQKMHCFEGKELPIDEDVTSYVETLAKNERSKIITDNRSMFEYSPVAPILD